MATMLDRKSLAESLRIVSKVVPRRTCVPILSNVMLSANGAFSLAATDLKTYVKVTLTEADDAGAWSVLANAETLSKIIKANKGSSLRLAPSSGPALAVDSAKVSGMDAEEFPAWPEVKDEVCIAEMHGETLAAAYSRVEFATSKDVVRYAYALQGILLETVQDTGTVNLVASDGNRLTWEAIKCGCAAADSRVSVKPEVFELVSLAVKNHPGESVKVYKGKDSPLIRFTLEDSMRGFRVDILSMEIDGRFPNYAAVFPSDITRTYSFSRADFQAALDKVIPFAPERHRAVKLTFAGGMLNLFCKGPDIGAATEEIPLLPVADAGEKFQAIYNPDFIMDFLKALPKDAETVNLALALEDKKSAATWRAGAVDGYAYLLMPLSITL